MRSRILLAALLAVAALLGGALLAGPASAAEADPAASWSIQPAGADAPDERPSFELTLPAPGGRSPSTSR